MEISHIEHLGIAVNSIEEHRPYYEQVLGLTCYSIEEVPDQKVKTDENRITGAYQPGQYHRKIYRKAR